MTQPQTRSAIDQVTLQVADLTLDSAARALASRRMPE